MSDPKGRMTKKDLKEFKITTYTNKAYFPFHWLNHRNFSVDLWG